MSDKKLSFLVDRFLPNFVESEYPQFREFVKACLEYVEQDEQAYDLVANYLDYQDIDSTLGALIPHFKEQYTKNFPESLQTDANLLIKLIRSFYKSKGTEDSFRVLFRLLYGVDIDFFYPKTKILKASDGYYYAPTFIVIEDSNGVLPPQLPLGGNYNLELLVDRFVIGASSGATAFVDETRQITYDGTAQLEHVLSFSQITGTFLPGELLLFDKEIVDNCSFIDGLQGWLYNSTDTAEIFVDNGELHLKQSATGIGVKYAYQKIYLSAGTNYKIIANILSADGAEVQIMVGTSPASTDVYTSGNLGTGAQIVEIDLTSAMFGSKTELYLTVQNGMQTVSQEVVFDSVAVVENKTDEPIIYISNVGGNSGVVEYPSTWYDSRGQLSSDMHLHDNYYYQLYSYEIKSPILRSVYNDIVQRHLHPAGMQMFGVVKASDADISQVTHTLTNTFTLGLTLNPEIFTHNTSGSISISKLKLGMQAFHSITYKYIEDNRETDPAWYYISEIADLEIGLFEQYPNQPFPIRPSFDIVINFQKSATMQVGWENPVENSETMTGQYLGYVDNNETMTGQYLGYIFNNESMAIQNAGTVTSTETMTSDYTQGIENSETAVADYLQSVSNSETVSIEWEKN